MKKHIENLFVKTGFNNIFSRSDIMKMMEISITSAGNLIQKLKDTNLIESISGYGNGKYKFKSIIQTISVHYGNKKIKNKKIFYSLTTMLH